MANKNANKTAALILAAGEGTRMRSKMPKVLHPVAGIPMVAQVVALALARKCDPVVVVVGSQGRRVREILTARFRDAPLVFAVQPEQLGTGDAARTGLAAIPKFSGKVLILYGDTPLLTAATVARLQRAAQNKGVALLTAELDAPQGYGRVIRNGREVERVVEERDATPAERAIHEVNVGVYVANAALLRRVVGKLGRNNAHEEYYLTDVVEVAAAGKGAAAVVTQDADETLGINDRQQLATADALLRRRRINELIALGVGVRDPAGLFIDADVRVDKDAQLGVGVQLYGATRVGRGAIVEGPSVLRDAVIEAGACVASFCHIERARVCKNARVGPFARLRPEAEVGEDAKVGNFVEMKKARLGKGAKANHLAYLGDADIGAGANIGAGTITCNYDGASKHRTDIGANVFVGSNSTLVAPLRLGAGVYVAAGSTITKDASPNALAIGRSRQVNRDGYATRLRARIAAMKRATPGGLPSAPPRPGGGGTRRRTKGRGRTVGQEH